MQLRIPAQFCCFFPTQTQKIVEAVGALDVLEDVPNVGAMREKRVDGCNKLALIDKNTLPCVGSGTAASSPWSTSRNIADALIVAVVRAQKMNQVPTH